MRMDLTGGLTVEVIEGSQCQESSPKVWLLVSKGHMRLLTKPKGAPEPPIVREVVAAGWGGPLRSSARARGANTRPGPRQMP